jgi:hypothetical protein
VSSEDEELVAAFWQEYRSSRGSRDERMQTGTTASDAIRERMDADPVGALALLDDLLGAPGANVAFIGAWAFEELLAEHGATVAQAVADRCRVSPSWREAVGCVWLDASERAAVVPLYPFLAEGRPHASPPS